VIIVKICQYWLNQNKQPPGPFGFPLLGHLPLLGSNPSVKCMQLAKKYGDIFRIRMGSWINIICSVVGFFGDANSRRTVEAILLCKRHLGVYDPNPRLLMSFVTLLEKNSGLSENISDCFTKASRIAVLLFKTTVGQLPIRIRKMSPYFFANCIHWRLHSKIASTVLREFASPKKPTTEQIILMEAEKLVEHLTEGLLPNNGRCPNKGNPNGPGGCLF
jgi:hypothetical protein